MFNTIILVIIGIIFTIYTIRTINGIDNNNFHISDLIIAILCLFIIIQARFYNTNATRAYDRGYDNAIKSAELIGADEDHYYITFGDNVHEYTFED